MSSYELVVNIAYFLVNKLNITKNKFEYKHCANWIFNY